MSSNSLNGKSVLSSFPGRTVAGIAAVGASRAGGLCNGPFAQYIVFINSLPQSLRSPGLDFPARGFGFSFRSILELFQAVRLPQSCASRRAVLSVK
jgi:hypothetical protein